MKVSLISPPYHGSLSELMAAFPNLAFVYLAGHLRASGHEVKIYDAMPKWATYEDIKNHLLNERPDVVATTAWTPCIYEAEKVLELSRRILPKSITVIGGQHPTFCYEQILKNDAVDFVVIGEGELTFPELLSAIEKKEDLSKVPGIAYKKDGKIFRTQDRELINLDSLISAWDIINFDDYKVAGLEKNNKPIRGVVLDSSRGCAFNCSFCSQKLFWRRHWRGKKPETFVSELEMLVKKYSVGYLFLSDDHPTADATRWEKILDLLIEKDLGLVILLEMRVPDIVRDRDILHKYKKAGILDIFVGVESVTEKRRSKFKKSINNDICKSAIDLIRENKMVSTCAFLMGIPEETKESIAETLDMAKNYYNPDFAIFAPLNPWPFSDIYNEVKSHIAVFDLSKYNMSTPVIKPIALSLEETKEEIRRCYRSFYEKKKEEWLCIEDIFLKKYLFSALSWMFGEKSWLYGTLDIKDLQI